MNILALDTCFGACSVAAGRASTSGGGVLAHEFERRQTGHAEALMPMIERVMTQARFAFSDIDRIAVTTGPGSFTGMRIGIAAARALSLATGAPVVGLPTLDVMAATARCDHKCLEGASALPAVMMVAVDARKDQVYVQVFGDLADQNRSALLLSPTDAARLVPQGGIALVGSGAAMVAKCIDPARAAVLVLFPDLQPNATCLADMAYCAELTAVPVRPNYLRPPDAKPQDGKSIPRVS